MGSARRWFGVGRLDRDPWLDYGRRMPIDCLTIDVNYRNTNNWRNGHDEFNSFFRFADGLGINNNAGFRFKRRVGGKSAVDDAAFVILVTALAEAQWPDALDLQTGLFVYYGDNRTPNREIAKTPIGGNGFLEKHFDRLHTGKREEVTPVLVFQSSPGVMRFLGLVVPGADGMTSDDDLVAVFRVAEGRRFANYRATFTVLDTMDVSKAWLEDLVGGVVPAKSAHCPKAWRVWVETGKIHALRAAMGPRPRTKAQQEPQDPAERAVLDTVTEALSARQFEFLAREVVALLGRRHIDAAELMVTRASVDGGFDVAGSFVFGHGHHSVRLPLRAEAKKWKGSIGIKEMKRLISRMRHRFLGVFVTTSWFNEQVQKELIEDEVPIVLVSGGDLARLLLDCGKADPARPDVLTEWLRGIKQAAAQAGDDSEAGGDAG